MIIVANERPDVLPHNFYSEFITDVKILSLLTAPARMGVHHQQFMVWSRVRIKLLRVSEQPPRTLVSGGGVGGATDSLNESVSQCASLSHGGDQGAGSVPRLCTLLHLCGW